MAEVVITGMVKHCKVLTIKEIFENIKVNNGIGYERKDDTITLKDYGIVCMYIKDMKGWTLKFYKNDGGEFLYGVNWLGGLIEEIRVGLDSLEVE